MSVQDEKNIRSLEEQLRTSQRLLTATLESNKEIIFFAVDLKCNLLCGNELYQTKMHQIYGNSLAPGDNHLNAITIELDRKEAQEVFERAFQGSATTTVKEFGNGDERSFFEMVYSPFCDEAGEVMGVTVSARDVTEHQRVLKVLERSEFFFRESQKAALIGSYQSEFYPQDRWITSEVCDHIFGMDETYEKTVKGWTELLHPDNAQEMINYVSEDVIGKGIPFDKEYKIVRRSDGATRWVWGLGNTIQDETGRTTGLIGTIQDITEKKEAEDKIRTLQDYLSNVIDSMPSILIGVDSSYRIIRFNKQASTTYNLSVEAVLGMAIGEILPDMNAELDLIDHSIKSNCTATRNRTISRNNQTHNEAITVFPIQSGSESGAVIRVDDVTKEVELQQRLNQSQKMDAIGQLAGGVAHDFNNILGGLMGLAEILLMPDSELDGENREAAEMILQATTRAADLTSKLLAFGRKGSTNFSVFDVHTCIEDTVALLERMIDKRITISTESRAENKTCNGNVSAIQNCLINLAINASHAMEQGGSLSFGTRNIFFDANYCQNCSFALDPGNYIEIEVRDSGTGIPLKHLNMIFDPFFTTKEQGKGTGLGLAAVYGTILDHSGSVSVQSELGNGTIFHLYLPCSESDEITPPRVTFDQTNGSGTILLIDDEKLMRVTGKHQLEALGYDVILAENGKEALGIYQGRHQDIDLVISDMVMPEMNGSETFHRLREINAECQVIISSGYARDESLDQLKKEGLAGFIQKPFSHEELQQLLRNHLK